MPIEAIPLPASGLRYLEVGEADDWVEALPGLSAYRSAGVDAKAAALDQATVDIDSAMPYQGRKLSPTQPLEFPRVFHESLGSSGVSAAGVWDWDANANTAVVPQEVRQATLHQADAILAGTRETRLDLEHDGVTYKQTGEEAESYKATPGPGGPAGPGVPTGLCRRAWMLMRRYRLRSGRLG